MQESYLEQLNPSQKEAVTTTDSASANSLWSKAAYTGDGGFGPSGDAPWVWISTFDYVYFLAEDVNITNERPDNYGNDLLINIEKVFSICDLLGLNNYDFASFCINVIKNQDIDKYSFKSKADMFKLFSNENIRLLISGNDLIQLGYPKDKKIGLILDSLFEVKIGKIADFKTKTDEINWVKNNFPLL